MKMRKNIPKVILIISLILVLILWPITFLTLNDGIWFLIQKRNDVTLPEEKIKMYDHQIVSFFKDQNKNLDFLTPREASHMQDVKNLITKTNLLFFISLILFLPTFIYSRKQFVKSALNKVSIFVLVFLILLLVIIGVGFNNFFLKFHEIFFVGNYMFPSTSMLKTLYPDNFFRDIFIVYFSLSILGCLAVWLASYRLKV